MMSKTLSHKPELAYQAFWLLRLVFIVAPIFVGLDKIFFGVIDWSIYLSPMAMSVLGSYTLAFFLFVGIVEVIVGIGIYYKPKIFGYIAAAWLFLITINLLMGGFFDIALRDFGLGLAAIALARLSMLWDTAA